MRFVCQAPLNNTKAFLLDDFHDSPQGVVLVQALEEELAVDV